MSDMEQADMEQTNLSIPAMVGAIHSFNAVMSVACASTERERVLIATSQETELPEEFADLNSLGPLTYFLEEFPSLRPHVYTTVSNSLAKFFVSVLPDDKRIRDVLWAFEPHLLRIWTIVDEPDFELEKKIFDAERNFLEKMDDSCDFTVVYAFGKPIAEIRPMGAVSVK